MSKQANLEKLEKLTDSELLKHIAYYQKRTALNLVFLTYLIIGSFILSAVTFVVSANNLEQAASKADHEQRLLEQQRRINEANR